MKRRKRKVKKRNSKKLTSEDKLDEIFTIPDKRDKPYDVGYLHDISEIGIVYEGVEIHNGKNAAALRHGQDLLHRRSI